MNFMKRFGTDIKVLAAVGLAVTVFWLGHLDATSSVGASTSTSTTTEILGEKAPDFELETTHGETVRLSDLEGKVVVLDFWAVWCGPCRDSMPYFENMQREHEKDGLVVIGLHVEDRMPSLEEVNDYLAEVGASYKNLVSKTEVDDAFDIVAMPTTYLVDRNGILKKRHIGFNPTRTPARLTKDIEALLAE